MAKNKNRRQETNSLAVAVTEKIPLVSVIIPMYNAARFISQTLESLLYQTMQDFEVIVVDDCSTDNSVEVVESFKEKFASGGGYQFHVVRLPENSGSPEVPRNLAIKFSRGKYIAFLDNDDLFTKTALEELSTLAEKYQADVVHTDAFFYFPDEKLKSATTAELLNMNHAVIKCNPNSPRLQQATDKPDDLTERVKIWINSDFHWATWALFCRRDFWVVNRIKFPQMSVSGDTIANFACLCLAKKLLRVPNITYINRFRPDSVSHSNIDLENYFHKWLSNLNRGFNEFDKVMKRFSFFEEHPDYRYAVLNWFFERVLLDARQLQAAYAQIHPAALNQFVQKEFQPEDAAFSAYLFNTLNIYRLQIMRLQQEINELKAGRRPPE